MTTRKNGRHSLSFDETTLALHVHTGPEPDRILPLLLYAEMADTPEFSDPAFHRFRVSAGGLAAAAFDLYALFSVEKPGKKLIEWVEARFFAKARAV